MPYTIRPKTSSGFGSFSVHAGDAREALNAAKAMIERGVADVEILDNSGAACDPLEVERIATEGELTR